MDYVKYTDKNGKVHLCHSDSPMLMHDSFFEPRAQASVDFVKAIISNIRKYCSEKKIKMETALDHIVWSIKYKDDAKVKDLVVGCTLSLPISINNIEKMSPKDVTPEINDDLDKELYLIESSFTEMKNDLIKHVYLTPDGYYVKK